MTYFTIDQIKQANRDAGNHFFDASSMRFFRSRILPGVIAGKYFITSEQFDHGYPRLYTIREATPDGDILDTSGFQAFKSARTARSEARKIAAGEPSQSAPCSDCQRWTLKSELERGYCPRCAAYNE